jgi:hypothetical protein
MNNFDIAPIIVAMIDNIIPFSHDDDVVVDVDDDDNDDAFDS